MPVETIKQFAQYGGYIGLLTAVMVVGLGFAVMYLWRYIQKLMVQINTTQEEHQKTLTSLQEEYQKTITSIQEKYQVTLTDLQDKRVEESKEVRELLMDFSNENNTVIRGLTEAMNAWKEAMVARRNT